MAHTRGPWTVVRGEYIIPLEHKDRSIGASMNSERDRDEYAQVIAMGRIRDDKHGRGSNLDNLKVMAAAPEMKLALLQIEAIVNEALEGGNHDQYIEGKLWAIKAVSSAVPRIDEHVDNQQLPF